MSRNNLIILILIVLIASCTLKAANQDRLNRLLAPTESTSDTSPTATPTATPTTSPTTTPTPSIVTIIPDGTIGQGYAYTTCRNITSITSSAPLPLADAGGEPEFSGLGYPNIARVDGTFAFNECAASLGNEAKIIEFSWTLPSASQFRTFTVSWTGKQGYYLGACDGSSAPSSTFSPPMQIYNGSNWVDFLQSPLQTLTTVSQAFSVPANYLVSNKIWVRLYSRSALGSCATIQTDSISLTLTP